MLGEIVADICMARPPIDSKLFLSHTILYLIIPHIHGIGIFPLNLLVCNPVEVANSTAVGVANKQIKGKNSNSMDMRYY